MDYKHVCSVETESRLYNQGARFELTNVSRRNPKTKYFFRSVGSVEKEKIRHASSKHSYIIHPLSIFRFYWECVYAILIYGSLAIIPINLCKPITYDELSYLSALDITETTLDFVMLLDVIVLFITGICLPAISEVVTHPRTIFKIRVRSLYFYIECMSSIPDNVTNGFIITLFANKLDTNFIIVFTTLPLLKIMRCLKFLRYYNNTMECMDNIYLRLFIKYFLMYLVATHWLTCFYIYVATFYDMFYPEVGFLITSFEGLQIMGNRMVVLYFETFYIVSSYLMGISLLCPYRKTLDYDFKEIEDALLFISISLVGFIFFSVFTVYLLQIMADMSDSEMKYQKIITQVKRYTHHRDLPMHIQDRVLTYYEYRYRKKFFQEKRIIGMLSDTLRRDVFFHTCRKLVENVSILKELPQDIVSDVISSLHREVYLYNDIIVKAGSVGECMYFIANGTVAVSTPTGREICHLQDGAYFGEIALVTKLHKRIASVVAIEICEIYRLDKKDFKVCFTESSNHYKKIEQIARERVDKTNLLEELHRKYISDRTRQKRLR